MKKNLILLSIFLLIIPSVFANNFSITFDINEDMKINEIVQLIFEEEQKFQNVSFLVEGNLISVSVYANNDPIPFLVDKSNKRTKVIALTNSIPYSNITFSFLISDLIFERGNTKQFFIILNLPLNISSRQVKIILPKGFYLEKCYPDCIKGSDGRRIFAFWNNISQQEFPISLIFKKEEFRASYFYFIIAFLAFVLGFLFFYYRKKSFENFLLPFSEEERKVILYLKKNKVCLQNKIEKEFGLSRVKTFRIIRKLEKIGLIKKEKFGRTNKIFWIK